MFYVMLDNERHDLPEISYSYFETEVNWDGYSDMEWKKYLRENNFYDLEDFSIESLENMELIYETEDAKYKFKFVCEMEKE